MYREGGVKTIYMACGVEFDVSCMHECKLVNVLNNGGPNVVDEKLVENPKYKNEIQSFIYFKTDFYKSYFTSFLFLISLRSHF